MMLEDLDDITHAQGNDYIIMSKLKLISHAAQRNLVHG